MDRPVAPIPGPHAWIALLSLILLLAFLAIPLGMGQPVTPPRGSQPVIMQLPDGKYLVSWTTETGNQFRVRFDEFEAIAIVKSNVQILMKSGRTIQTGIDDADWVAVLDKVPDLFPRTIATLEKTE